MNALGDELRTERLGELEASALLGQVLEEIDVAIFAFDGEGELRLVNRAGGQAAAASALAAPRARRGLAGHGRAPRGRDAAAAGDRLRRTGRPVRAPPLAVPARGAAAHAGGPGRPPPGGARGGARGLAAHRPGAEPRDQQLARAHPEHRHEPPGGAGTRATPRSGWTTCAPGSPWWPAGARRSPASSPPTPGWRGCPPPTLAPVSVPALVQRVAGARREHRASGWCPARRPGSVGTPISSSSC